jgi:hypothetical protein
MNVCMSDLSVKKLVHAPPASAARFLTIYFDAHKVPRAEADASVELHAHGLSQPATVTLRRVHRPAEMTPHYDVSWQSAGTGLFPRFQGLLSVGGGDDYDVFWLTLDGSYKPPLGLAGKVFDAVVGHRVAIETADGLLAEIAADAESHFAAEEAAKPGV